jgi:CSLREA domain-containing protein
MLTGSLILIAFSSAGNADAATLKVTTTADTIDFECTVSLCSLRDAVEAADAASEEDTITLPAGEYDLTVQALDLTNSHRISIEGAGARSTIVKGGEPYRVLEVGPSAAAKVTGVTLSGGAPLEESRNEEFEYGRGGTVLNEGNLTLEEGRVTGGLGEYGGGLFSGGVVTVIRSLIDDNRSTYQGGGAELAGEATFRDSTIANNEVNSGLSLIADKRGGGEVGGGLVNYGSLALAGTTVADNSLATGRGSEGAGVALAQGFASAANSLVTGNEGEASQCAGGKFAAMAPNLDSDGSCFEGQNELHGDALLGALAENGGPTDTLKPGAGSPAIGAGESCDGIDQRGEPRPENGCELGAFEQAHSDQGTTTTTTTTTMTATTATLAPSIPALPSNAFSFTTHRHAAHALGVRVSVHGPGNVSAIATEEDPGLRAHIALLPGRNRFRYASARAFVSRGGSIVLVLKPTRAGRAIAARHRHHRWPLTVRVAVTFTPLGGYPRTIVKSLRLFLGG